MPSRFLEILCAKGRAAGQLLGALLAFQGRHESVAQVDGLIALPVRLARADFGRRALSTGARLSPLIASTSFFTK